MNEASRADTRRVVERLIAAPPAFHSDGTRTWNALPNILAMLADLVTDGGTTLETGCGASTLVFAAAGCKHTSISPFPGEHRLVQAYADEHQIPMDRVGFVAGSSQDVLPTLSGHFDVAFIDGKHSFPAPVVDFNYVWPLLNVGGYLVLDDVPIPAVQVVHRFCESAPEWELVRFAENRAAAFRKIADPEDEDNWRRQPFNASWPNFSYASPTDRLRLLLAEKVPEVRRRAGANHPRLREQVRALRGRQ